MIAWIFQGNILADGTDAVDLARWNAEHELSAAESQAAAEIPGAEARLQAAEQKLDQLMHASLDNCGSAP